MPYHRIQYQFAVEGSDGQHVLLSDRGIRADTAENRLKKIIFGYHIFKKLTVLKPLIGLKLRCGIRYSRSGLQMAIKAMIPRV